MTVLGRSATDGLTVAVTAVAFLALTSRFFPGLLSDRGIAELLPNTRGRLSFPLGYWNGLGIFVALAFPLLLAAASLDRRPLLRGLAVTPLPALVAVIYLTSSRGAVAMQWSSSPRRTMQGCGSKAEPHSSASRSTS